MIENKYLGHPLQLSGVEEYRLQGGRGDGMHLLRVRNGLGIDFTICADRCADISELYLDGVRMNYTAPCGYVSPQYYSENSDGFGFLTSFNCGFITTCGLQNIGLPNNDGTVFRGLHGSISNTPADYIYYETTADALLIHATIRDQVIFGTKFTMKRTIQCSLIENIITLDDTICNEGSKEEPVMLLYHMNIGYPLLDEHTNLTINSKEVIPRDDRAAEDLATWHKMITPTPNFVEQCYYHIPQSCTTKALITNDTIGKGVEISFDSKTFPLLTQWKMMGEHDYVLGIEPCTNTLEGRNTVKERGELLTLKPGEQKNFSIAAKFIRTK